MSFTVHFPHFVYLVDESLFRQISFYEIFNVPGKITSTKSPPPKNDMFFFFPVYFLHDHIYTAFPARETAFPKSTWIFGTPCLIFLFFPRLPGYRVRSSLPDIPVLPTSDWMYYLIFLFS